jgi:uncharacterized protein (TIGR02611 family)
MSRLARAIIGVILVLLGTLLLVLPGPGIVTIAAGLAVLATEFAWARRLLEWFKTRFEGYLSTYTTSDAPVVEEDVTPD